MALQSISSLREKLDAGVAAVLYETVPASVGLPVPPAGFYAEVRRACDEAGALLIIDEVQTGWGRSGKLWAIEHYGVVPDIMVLGKGMSAGHYPMSAVCFRPHLGGYLTRDSFRHQSTMGWAADRLRRGPEAARHPDRAGLLAPCTPHGGRLHGGA